MPSGLRLVFTTSQKPNQAIRRVGWLTRCCLCLFLLGVLFINLKHPSSNSVTGFYKAGVHAHSRKAILRGLGLCSQSSGDSGVLGKIPILLSAHHSPLWSTPGLLHGHRWSSCLLHSYRDGKQSKNNLFCIYVQTISTVLCIYNVLITAVCLSLGFMLIQHIYPLVLFSN